ncbi:MAG: ATP-dependent helicase [Chitinophagia bacterium]|nr:ATP-dependent helicase [Chitinophagia bacterium]
MTTSAIYHQHYEKLNDAQKNAVNTIFGPVMAIAGPGTGKTEVLAMRIANMLQSDAQIAPGEILCLTYTDEATNSMRNRLLKIIGIEAHKVHIYTFHAFCNSVIQAHSEYFSHRNLQVIDDLERTEIVRDLISTIDPDSPLMRFAGNLYYDTANLISLFQLMKSENYTPQLISQAIDSYLADLPNRDEYIYKKSGSGYKKGDVKQKQIDEQTKRMEKTRAAAMLFPAYQKALDDKGKYDFADMILWVIAAFEKHEWMLQTYQERFQYILVDEFQDTNGAQNHIINLLTADVDSPNLFVVGDDDQSIFEFQGARLQNIMDCYKKHEASMEVIVLKENYRSTQPILNTVMAGIANNQLRLINQLNYLGIDKNLTAAHPVYLNAPPEHLPIPEIHAYYNAEMELIGITQKIALLQQQGVPLNSIAVLYAQHKQADTLIALLRRKGIPFKVRKPENILENHLIQQILNLLTYIDEEITDSYNGEHLLFELMHAPYWGIEPQYIELLALYIRKHNAQHDEEERLYWRTLIRNAKVVHELLPPEAAERVLNLGSLLDDWQQTQTIIPLTQLLETILHKAGILDYLLLNEGYLLQVQVLHTFIEFVKSLAERIPVLRIATLLDKIDIMRQENIAVPAQQVVQNESGVQLYTAHSAKGHEFEYVFLMGCNAKFWEKKRAPAGRFTLPDTLTHTADKEETPQEEAARRLFFVALSRAKRHLYVSYALNDKKGEIPKSAFIDEIKPAALEKPQVVEQEKALEDLIMLLQAKPLLTLQTENEQYIDSVIENLVMSASALSAYLECPIAFYYNYILKIPSVTNDSAAYGNAVHAALEQWYRQMRKQKGEFPDLEFLLAVFNKELNKRKSFFTDVQLSRKAQLGNNTLTQYYNNNVLTLNTNAETEFSIPTYDLEGVPVMARMDNVATDNTQVEIIDYKTGNPDNIAKDLKEPTEEKPAGGNYWRQMAFYKLVFEARPGNSKIVASGAIHSLAPDKDRNLKNYYIPLYQKDTDAVKKLLTNSYNAIKNKTFSPGCGEETCTWCAFVKSYGLVGVNEEV